MRSSTSRHFEDALRQKIVGQDEAVQALVELHQVFCAGLRSPGRPVGNLLFLGPTGSGKTRIVEAAAEILFGDSRAVIKVDCAEFQHSHEIAKLIGSPPGYLGHRETHPLITQEALAASHTDKLKLSFLLFDEIEKASDGLWQLLLGMLDKATLTLGDNRKVDLSQTVIFPPAASISIQIWTAAAFLPAAATNSSSQDASSSLRPSGSCRNMRFRRSEPLSPSLSIVGRRHAGMLRRAISLKAPHG